MPPSSCISSLARRITLSTNNRKLSALRLAHFTLQGVRADSGTQQNAALQRLKHPARGGQNLSARYARLERSLRGKEEYLGEIEGYAASGDDGVDVVDGGGGLGTTSARARKLPKQLVFRGFVVPEEPKAPEPDECCMSGCAVCVHDLYQESLEAYEASVKALRASLTALGVDEAEWPERIRLGRGEKKIERKKDVALSAFEQMELQLAAKREKKGSVVDVGASSVSTSRPDGHIGPPKKKKQGDLNAGALLEAINWVVFSRK